MDKALVVDDDALNLRLMSAMLSHYGYDVYASSRGDQGVDMAIEVEPDVVLLDLLMPKPTYDGADVAKILRGMPQFATTPIIAVSAADIYTIQSMLDSNLFTDFIQKPITRHKLDLILKQVSLNTA